jgi:hypothetical protein
VTNVSKKRVFTKSLYFLFRSRKKRVIQPDGEVTCRQRTLDQSGGEQQLGGEGPSLHHL